MIDEDRTLQLYDYTSDMLSKGSSKPIVKVCDDCGTYSIVRKGAYHDLCKSCSHKNPSDEIRKKISEANKGRKCNNKTKIKISIANTGEKNGMYGKKHSKETKKKIGKSNKGKNKGIKHNYEYRINISCIAQGISRNEWTGFLTNQKYCSLFNESFKTKIRNQFNNKCFLCSKSKQEEGKNLAVHHVNYNKNCLCGSNCEFVPLCCKCHSKTNGNRQYWENLIMGYLYPERYFMVEI